MVVWHLADVSLNPTVNALPGGGTLQELTNGLGAWALIASLAGLLIGAAAWALGVHAQNYQQSLVGRRAVLVSGLAALLIGAAPPIVNFFFHTGTNLHCSPCSPSKQPTAPASTRSIPSARSGASAARSPRPGS